jgi:hypothetical protein
MTTGSSEARCPVCGAPYQVSPHLFFRWDMIAYRCPLHLILAAVPARPGSHGIVVWAGSLAMPTADFTFQSDTTRAAA